ncbi:hypothetical protein [Methanocaldococcus sp.]
MNTYILLFAIFSLTFSALTGLRLAFKKETSNVLIGEGIITVVIGTLMVLLSKLFNIAFASTIALAIFICGAVGTLAFCKVIGGDNGKK